LLSLLACQARSESSHYQLLLLFWL
jgi:hypothetical protein